MAPKTGDLHRDEVGKELTRYADTALRLLANGYAPLPVKAGTKEPRKPGWQYRCDRLPTQALIDGESEAHSEDGAGIACGSIVVIDSDFKCPQLAEKAERIIREKTEPHGMLKRVGAAPKFAMVFRASEKIRTRHCKGRFDILGTGSYLVAFGIHPKTGEPYRWDGPSPLGVLSAALPLINKRQVHEIFAALNELASQSSGTHNHKASGAVITGSLAELVLEGRDSHLRDIVYRLWCSGVCDGDTLTRLAWQGFCATSELQRPKRDGPTLWSEADARAKAAQLLQRAEKGLVCPSGDLRFDRKWEPFVHAIHALGAYDQLSPAAVRLSALMLCLCGTEAGCFASIETLARQLDLAERSVKRLRQKLVELGLWSRKRPPGLRGGPFHFFPCAEKGEELARQVTAMGTYKPVVIEDTPLKLQDSIEEQIKKNYAVGFEFLGTFAAETAA